MATSVDDVASRIGRVVRASRVERGLSVSALAREADLSKTIVGRIEAGEGNPSIDTLWRISQALGLPLGALIAEETEPRVRLIGARTGERLSGEEGMRAWLVHAAAREHRGELYDLELPAGGEQRTPAHLPGTEEVIVCLGGRLSVGPLGREVTLGAGDAVWFSSDVEHRYVAVGRAAARALCWMLYPPAR